jgi:hypothetical protein
LGSCMSLGRCSWKLLLESFLILPGGQLRGEV